MGNESPNSAGLNSCAYNVKRLPSGGIIYNTTCDRIAWGGTYEAVDLS